MPYVKTKDCKDYPEVVKMVYEHLNRRFGTSARVSSIYELWESAYGMEEYDLLDKKDPDVQSFLTDFMEIVIDWNNKKPVDLENLYEKFLRSGDFTRSEIQLFESGEPAKRMWAVLLAITDTINQNKIY